MIAAQPYGKMYFQWRLTDYQEEVFGKMERKGWVKVYKGSGHPCVMITDKGRKNAAKEWP